MPNLTRDDLNNIDILQWSEIRSNYERPNLFLGNGFSVNLSENFSQALLSEALIERATGPLKALFQHFEATSFELILKYLTHSIIVNTVLGLPTAVLAETIESLKANVINTSEEIHPRAVNIYRNIIDIFATELDRYGDIYTVNNDLYLYRIILANNDRHSIINHKYQDYFWGEFEGGRYTKFMQRQGREYKNIYYLHGTLFFFNRGSDIFKIIKGGRETELIELIADEIQQGNTPVVVVGSNPEDKRVAIAENRYLNFCWDAFRNANRPFLIFGHAFSEGDDHILDVFNEKMQPLFISIHTNGKSINDLEQERDRIRSKFQGHEERIVFIDSATVFPNTVA